MISEKSCTFIVLKDKGLQTIFAMITEDKVTEIFCIADDLASPIFNSASLLVTKAISAGTCLRGFSLTAYNSLLS
ncbi:hypothetical protein [Xylanibacter oryzae]|uniref:hypothetical protein n=1 Tax=Xylanibacter oryzae TaxID=185293 RepID=UPI001B7F8164|nr:hypothetical protein [Xylanibacter oryzae]